MKIRYLSAVSLFAVASVYSNVAGATSGEAALELCSKALVPDDVLSSNGRDEDEALHSALCGDWYNSHQKTVDDSLGVSAVIKVVPVSVNGSSKVTASDMSRTQYCAQNNHHVSATSRNSIWWKVVPESARLAAVSCAKALIGPHPVKVDATQTRDTLVVSSRYDASYGGATPALISVTGDNLKCDAVTKSLLPSQGDGLAVRCAWTSDIALDTAVVVHTTRGDEILSVSRKKPLVARVTQSIYTPTQIANPPQDVCSGWVPTADMNEWRPDRGDGRCNATSDDGRFCKGKYFISLAPVANGTLSEPWVNCRRDTGSCAWNDLLKHSWFNRAGAGFNVEFWAGSRTVEVQACAKETTSRTEVRPTSRDAIQLSRGGTFSIEVPDNSTSTLSVEWLSDDQSHETIEAGKGTARFTIVSSIHTGAVTTYNYRLDSK